MPRIAISASPNGISTIPDIHIVCAATSAPLKLALKMRI
jgi:hypothetical protein